MSHKNDLQNVSEEDMKLMLSLLEKKRVHDKKVKAGTIKGYKKWSEYSQDEKERAYKINKKRLIKQKLLAQKALDAGLTVSEEEITLEMNKTE